MPRLPFRPAAFSILLAVCAVAGPAAQPARADVHTVRISEFYTQCDDGSTDVQYIEVRPYNISQFFRQCASLQVKRTVAGPDVFFAKPIFAGKLDSDAFATTKTWLIATPAFQAKTGIVPDFLIPNGTLNPAGGVLRFAADSGCEPNTNWGTIHEVRYGDQGTVPAPGPNQAANYVSSSATYTLGNRSPKNFAGSSATSWTCDVAGPTVSVTSPNGGEMFVESSQHVITWSASDNVAVTTVDLELSTDGGMNWSSLAVGEANDGAWDWAVPTMATTTEALIRVTARDAAMNSGQDQSDAVFTIQSVTGTPDRPPGFLRPMLFQNRPNPFTPSTVIAYALAKTGPARIRVFSVAGRPVRTLLDAERPAGYAELSWDGRADDGAPLPSGVYFYSLETGGTREIRRMVLSK